ncbi:hypothetical protein [Evansella cellulosilytica]|uniref:Uncharacterized protein n=1 Tax=Evansella cellulosilytica (strain ATCC 21833 / DSM 2522 / FERM P-1141 / JCM 9156 / N-4) TaxID=649639 RepID=E6TY14_EVAC2|nr:hypothetical protein [Evansella cellulosilytica]ADU31227.1 hypothetical protein Bcell_2977 [Evansella cellulosilytica DSM 2522]
MKKTILYILLLTLVSCHYSPAPSMIDSSHESPIFEQFKMFPLMVTYTETNEFEDFFTLTFEFTHVDDTPLSPDDYVVRFPSYIFDENNIPYKISQYNIDIHNHESFFVNLDVAPQLDTHSKKLMIPITITPSLYEEGYLFTITNNESDNLSLGDMHLHNINIDKNHISFELYDEYQQTLNRNISYDFMKLKENQKVYPLLSNVTYKNTGKLIELSFAHSLEYPIELIIHRTTVTLPQWEFTFIVDVN